MDEGFAVRLGPWLGTTDFMCRPNAQVFRISTACKSAPAEVNSAWSRAICDHCIKLI